MHRYTLAVKRDFVARHYLVGGDWGAENDLHSHNYQVEVQLEGKILDEHGYLVDIVAVEAHLEELAAYYRDQTLNDLPEFAGLNPSIEHFARILCQELLSRVPNPSAPSRCKSGKTTSPGPPTARNVSACGPAHLWEPATISGGFIYDRHLVRYLRER